MNRDPDCARGSVVVVGNALIDDIVAPDSTCVSRVGGAGVNVASVLAGRVLDVKLVASLGQDPRGDLIRSHLDRVGVGLVAQPPLSSTGRACAHIEMGQPTRYTFHEVHRGAVFTDELRRAIRDADIVVVSSYPFEVRSAVQQLRSVIASTKALCFVDANVRTDSSMIESFEAGLVTMLPTVDVLKASDDDIARLGWSSTGLLAARRGGPQVLVHTRGAGGMDAHTLGASYRVAASRCTVPVLDTIGAGDAALASIVRSTVLHAKASGGGSMSLPAADHWPEILQIAADEARDACERMNRTQEAASTAPRLGGRAQT